MKLGDTNYTVSHPFSGIVMIIKCKTNWNSYLNMVIFRITTNLAYISNLFMSKLVKILSELILTCKDANKRDVKKLMNNHSVIHLGDRLVIEKDFKVNSDFMDLRSLGDAGTSPWKQWENTEEFPADLIMRKLLKLISNIYRFLPKNDGFFHYHISFITIRSTDKLENQPLMSIVDEFFALDRWEMNFSACDSTHNWIQTF
jgi:hypothetical protein